MLPEGREATSYLYNTDKETKVYTIGSRWLNVCRTGHQTFGERLTFDDVVAGDETIQACARARSSRATDEFGSFSRRR